MIDQSHIDTRIVYESAENIFNVSASALHIEPFPYEIQTTLGNEKPFVLTHVKEFADEPIAAKYQQVDSQLILYVYAD